MSQLALARRYRPHTFQEMVGQDVTVRALSNALDLKRLHHAYLFTGTRGVGKTSVARILAKCLNCEQGISSTPCGTCFACEAIDQGRFVDLIEVDAASRTKVEDTRELLDNVQYLPTRGRFKIYLIDEVHMLSGHSFNALLKTLEEPPLHVKFLLATTDPQKLPATILSRCLQFQLWRFPINKIVPYLAEILQREKVLFEEEALQELARAADGSLRDAMSLLDQALNYCEGTVEVCSVRLMLGLSEKARLLALLNSLANGDAKSILNEINALQDSAPDFSGLLTEFLELIHQVAIAQSVPEALEENRRDREAILAFAKTILPEEIQLYYQIGLQGQRDLPYAPNPKMGFEMILLRMLAFQPVKVSNFVAKSKAQVETAVETKKVTPEPEVREQKAEQTKQRESQKSEVILERQDWSNLVNELKLKGLENVLAINCTVVTWEDNLISLNLDESQKPLLGNKRYEDRLQEALSQHLGKPIHLKITCGGVVGETPALQTKRLLTAVQEAASTQAEADPEIQKLMKAFDAKIEHIDLKEEQ
ncbi:MAG TPA: DNA polymerase III subunit gamma/tau [Gammaproteobacteria bacterium]|nr:DNA polymerase III subunit gamma/tau [Gammaproteobacteria bacterium]